MLVVGLVVGALAASLSNDIHNLVYFKSARSSVSAAEGATQAQITAMRYVYATTCPGTPYPLDGASIVVTCTRDRQSCEHCLARRHLHRGPPESKHQGPDRSSGDLRRLLGRVQQERLSCVDAEPNVLRVRDDHQQLGRDSGRALVAGDHSGDDLANPIDVGDRTARSLHSDSDPARGLHQLGVESAHVVEALEYQAMRTC
jgi:hypothetical protein